MITNNESFGWDYYNYENVSPIALVEKAERRIVEKKRVIEDMQNECDLLEKQAFDLYKKYVNYPTLNYDYIMSISKWLHMKSTGVDSEGRKLDGRKKYEEKDMYEYMIDYLQKIIGIEDMEIVEIRHYNFGEELEIIFNSNGHKWMLGVPVMNNIYIKSYIRYGSDVFKLKLYNIDTRHFQILFDSTFEEKELKDIFTKALEEYNDKEL